MLRNRVLLLAIALFCGLLAATGAHAQVLISEDFDTATTANSWYFFNGACLTASTAAATSNPGTPPGCTAIASSYYMENLVGGYNGAAGDAVTLPDPVGDGALRFTNGCIPSGGGCANGGHGQNGAIISAGTYSTSAGLNITFKTMSYRGDSGGDAGDGADGMSFFLMDASIATAAELAADPADAIGSWGGSLGYTCSNTNTDYHGMIGAWLGLGIDEYGNFLNGESDTLGEDSPYGVSGDNTASGGGYQPDRIGLRGRGNIAYPWLSANYPDDYPADVPSSDQILAVQNTCETGTLWNYSQYSPSSSDYSATPTATNTSTAVDDYAAVPGVSVLSSTIANEYATGGYGQLNATPITYQLKITQNGLLTLSYSYNGGAWKGVIQNEPITSVNSGPLPANVRFGFAGSTGGSSNIHEILCFKASPATGAASSTTGNEKESSKVDAGSQVYFGSYDPTDWTGSLAAYGLITNSSGEVTGIASSANWDASCVLTGLASSSNTCATTGVSGPVAAESPSSRAILTWSGTAGIPFEWSDLTTAEQNALNAVDSDGQSRLAFLRGDRTNEVPNGSNLFRARDSVLADIVDSSPAWSGPPSQSLYFSYETPTAWVDRLYTSATMPENSGQSYTAYATAEQTRQNVVYVGANDGLLHGFAAGSYNTDSSYNSAGNTGTEVLAYVPEEVLLGIHPTVTTTTTVTTVHHVTTTTTTTAVNSTLDFSNPQYGHNFYVDAPPGTGDLYYGGAWHTWVVGGLGPGLSGPWTPQASCGGTSMPTCGSAWSSTTTYSFGNTVSLNGVNYVANWQNENQSPASDVAVGQGEIYALDVTNPTALSESNAATLVKGDWIGGTSATTNPGSFTCSNVANCALNLGFTYGTPEVRRLHDGDWAIIFGNGIGSSTGDAGIFILTINPTSGAQTMYYLSTGVKGGNGIAYVSAVDMDHDHVTDYVYAGDLLGNVWRFNLTSNSESSWHVDTGPLFKTPTGQPITSEVVPQFVTVNGATQVMLYFGTGEKTPQTSTSGTSYSSGTQAFYAVWDWNMSAWNALHSSQFATLSTTQIAGIAGVGSSPYTLGTANLADTAITTDSNGDRLASTTAQVCWADSTTCTSGNTQFGWYINLPGTNTGYGTTTYEQVVYSPLILSTVVIFNSILPAIDSPLECTAGFDSGWSYALNVSTGAAISGFWQGYSSTLPSNTGGYESNATGTMYYAGGAVIYQTTSGQHIPVPVPLPPDISGGRETWVQIR